MPRTLSYTDKALADLETAETWLRQHGSGPAAWAKFDAIVSAIEGLRAHPCRWPQGRHPGVRERLCAGGWRAFYEVDPDTGRDETAGDVRVLRVYGPGHLAAETIPQTTKEILVAHATGRRAPKLPTSGSQRCRLR